jgi:hypothetical protein
MLSEGHISSILRPPIWRGENTHPGALNFYPIFIPLFEAKVSGVSVQDMLFCLPFLTPET